MLGRHVPDDVSMGPEGGGDGLDAWVVLDEELVVGVVHVRGGGEGVYKLEAGFHAS